MYYRFSYVLTIQIGTDSSVTGKWQMSLERHHLSLEMGCWSCYKKSRSVSPQLSLAVSDTTLREQGGCIKDSPLFFWKSGAWFAKFCKWTNSTWKEELSQFISSRNWAFWDRTFRSIWYQTCIWFNSFWQFLCLFWQFQCDILNIWNWEERS